VRYWHETSTIDTFKNWLAISEAELREFSMELICRFEEDIRANTTVLIKHYCQAISAVPAAILSADYDQTSLTLSACHFLTCPRVSFMMLKEKSLTSEKNKKVWKHGFENNTNRLKYHSQRVNSGLVMQCVSELDRANCLSNFHISMPHNRQVRQEDVRPHPESKRGQHSFHCRISSLCNCFIADKSL
jgi:hypothetical protein